MNVRIVLAQPIFNCQVAQLVAQAVLNRKVERSNRSSATTFTNPQQVWGFRISGDKMAATLDALYSQNSSQTGLTVAGAFPQVTPNGVAPQNLDLVQIITKKGGAILAKVDFSGNVVSGAQTGLAIASVSVTSFAVTQVTASTGVVLGTFTGGAANAFTGKKVAILGFSNAGNNGTFTILTSSATQITIATVGLTDETASATASVYGVSTAVYHGTIANPPSVGTALSVTGFTNTSNNILSTPVTASNGTTITVLFAGQVAETHVAAASITVAGTNGYRICQQNTSFAASDNATLAQIFADAFVNPSLQDILQVINAGGNIHYYVDYLGVAHGS